MFTPTPMHFSTFCVLSFCLCTTTFGNSRLALTSITALEDVCTKEQAPGFCYQHGSQSLIKEKGRGGEALGAKIWNRKNTSSGCFETHIAHSRLL